MNDMSVRLGKKTLAPGEPYIVAEIGVNHNGSFDIACKCIESAKSCGVDAVKFQNFSAEKLTRTSAPKAPYQLRNDQSKNESHFDMLKKLEMNHDMTRKVKQHCDQLEIEFLSTPYDPENVQFLADLGISAVKVSSADIIDFSIHECIQKNALPCLQGLGMSTHEEVESLVQFYQRNDTSPSLVLLQCTSNYPADPENSNIAYLDQLNKSFPQLLTGFSDHTRDHLSAILALARGACYFEKHFTLDQNMPGPDHKASCEPSEMKDYVDAIHRARRVLGQGTKKIMAEEAETRKISRKGAYLLKDIKAGESIHFEDLHFARPANDYPMSLIWPHLGHRAARNLQKGQQINPLDFK